MNELALFSGAGGGILGGHLLGWRTVCAVEWEPYPASVLCARQNDKVLPTFPIWDDIRTFDGRPWRGVAQVISGGFPCQDISAAGKGTGITGSRSGLWGEMARVIREVRPRFCFVENSPMLTSRGLGTVLGDLAAMGFDAKWGVLGAADIGAPHQRDRIWIVGKQMGNTYNNGPITSEISKSLAQRSDSSSTQQEQTSQLERSSEQHGQVAYTTKQRLQREQRKKFEGHGNGFANKGKDVAYTASIRQQRQGKHEQPINSAQSRNRKANYVESIGRPDQWATEPDLGRVANGVAARVDRLKAIGNGQVPLCAATAWKLLTGEMK